LRSGENGDAAVLHAMMLPWRGIKASPAGRAFTARHWQARNGFDAAAEAFRISCRAPQRCANSIKDQKAHTGGDDTVRANFKPSETKPNGSGHGQ
jgi:hypothetical protein